jgi:hypothetical protein
MREQTPFFSVIRGSKSMFGKTKESNEIDDRPAVELMIDDFFGDEAAVAETVRIEQLHQRVTSVEQQINSQFTSMAAYAQIAQEQIELVRSEAQHANERSEQRVTTLIDQERSDRLTEGGATPDVTARLDALELQVAEIRENLTLCLSNQKALADAITDLFQPAAASSFAAVASAVPIEPTRGPLLDDNTPTTLDAVADFDVFAAPDIATVVPMSALPAPILSGSLAPVDFPAPLHLDGPIAALSLD